MTTRLSCFPAPKPIFIFKLNTLSSGAYINIPGSGFTSYGGLALVDDYQAIAADKDTTAGAAVTSEFEAEKQNMT